MAQKPCDEPCPKCGGADVLRKFQKRGEVVRNEGYDKCANKFASGMCNYFKATRDHIDNFCRICSHRWQVKPLSKARRPERMEASR
jgi:ssDNA-binding Zn-finger/Zn-ribbon topoisomerase 1